MSNRDVEWLLSGEPREVQMAALESYYRQTDAEVPPGGWAYFMEMRLGKSAVAMNEFLQLRKGGSTNRMLMLAPNSYKRSWKPEAEKMGFDGRVHVYESKDKFLSKVWLKKYYHEGGMFVINYEAIRSSEVQEMLSYWADGAFIVGDESVMIKNKDAAASKAALALSKMATRSRVLTGLPWPQGPHDLWHQLRFAKRLNGSEFTRFKNKYCEFDHHVKTRLKRVLNKEDLEKLLLRTSFRATRKEWGSRLPTEFEVVPLTMTREQKRCYDEMENTYLTWLSSGEEISVEQAISKYIKMQQISSGVVLDELGEAHQVHPFEKTPKFMHLKERLKTEVTGKVFIVAHFTNTLRLLHENLREFNPAMLAKGFDVEMQKKKFNEEPTCRILIGQLKKSKYGHNLMGPQDDPCLTQVFFENNYSLDDRAQVEERCQGVGQMGNMHIWDYACSELESRVIATLQRKKDVADLIMGR